MAIEINDFTLPWTVSDARYFLQQQTDKFGVFFDVDRCFELIAIMQRENLRLFMESRELMHSTTFDIKNKDARIQALLNAGVNPVHFNIYKKDQWVLDSKVYEHIRQDTSVSDLALELVERFAKYTSNTRNMGYFMNLAELPHSVELSKNNHRMSVGHPTYSILSTSRIGAANPGVQGIPRDTPEILTEPKGYTMFRADSAQIEPKINFSYFNKDELIINLITHYKDAYRGILHFCEMSIEEENRVREDWSSFVSKGDDPEFKENRQVIKRLTNAGSYGSGDLTTIHPRLGKLYEMKIVNHPARLAHVREVTQAVNRGVDTFYGAFGTPVTPGSTEKYTKGEGNWNDHLIRCGINNPVQTTASELMLFSIYRAKEILSRAKDTHVAFYKHDEAIFYISDYDMEHGIGEELEDITAYNVKGWIPIECDGLYGVKYEGQYPMYL